MKKTISKFLVRLNFLSHRAKKVQFLILCILSLLFACFASLYLGSDIGYDLKNYHLYNAWALLYNRSEIDLFAAGMHTYFPPLLELPYYWLSFVWFPDSIKFVTFLMGIPGGVFLILTHLTILSFFKSTTNLPRIYLYLLSIPFSLFAISNSFLWLVGSTSGDLPVACFVLGAIYTFFRVPKFPVFASIVPGTLIGIAIGLKFTAISYSLPFVLAIIVFFSCRKQKIQSVILFSLSCGTAFLATYGWWGWRLFQVTGNPIFPVFDNFYPKWIFPSILGDDLFSKFYRPDGLLKKLYYLFTAHHYGLINIFIGICLLLFFFKKLIYLFCKFSLGFSKKIKKIDFLPEKKKKNHSSKVSLTRIHFSLLIFYFGTLLIWRWRLSEPRYIMALDALSAILIFLGIFQLSNFTRKQILPVMFLSMSILFIMKKEFLETKLYSPKTLRSIQNKEHGRFIGQESKFKVPALPQDTLVLTGLATSFLAPFFAQENSSLIFVGGVSDFNTKRILPDSIMKEKIQEKIKKHKGQIYLLTIPEITDPIIKYMNLRDEEGRILHEINFFPQYGLKLELSQQIRFSNKFGNFLLIPAYPENSNTNSLLK